MDKLNILAIDYNSLFARNWHASGGAERGEAYQRTVQWVQQARGAWCSARRAPSALGRKGGAETQRRRRERA